MNKGAVWIKFAIVAGFLAAFSVVPSRAQTASAPEDSRVVTTAPQTAETGKKEVVKGGKDVSAPILVHAVEPIYSDTAQKTHLNAIVIVNCYIEPDGTTSNVHAVRITLEKNKSSADPLITQNQLTKEFTDNAADAVKRYKFRPAMKDGKPVRVELNVDVRFVFKH
jgi:Gram-negative bacterial TonB protein C-terminal